MGRDISTDITKLGECWLYRNCVENLLANEPRRKYGHSVWIRFRQPQKHERDDATFWWLIYSATHPEWNEMERTIAANFKTGYWFSPTSYWNWAKQYNIEFPLVSRERRREVRRGSQV